MYWRISDDNESVQSRSEAEKNTNPELNRKRISPWRIWRVEIFCVLGSTLCLIAMVALLRVVDGKPIMPHLRLNTIVAVLATTAKALFMVPLTEALGQWKWNWFYRRPRSVAWFQVFDGASRNTLGSLDLVVQLGLRHIATFGAAASVMSIFMSLATQEAVAYGSKLAPDSSAQSWVKAATFLDMNAHTHRDVVDGQMIDRVLQDTIIGLDRSADLNRIPFCPSTNCTFPLFNSTSLCVKSADISSSLEVHRLTGVDIPWTVSLPKPHNLISGLNVSLSSDVLSVIIPQGMRYASPINRSVAFGADSGPYRAGILNLAVILPNIPDTDDAGNPSISAYEYLFHSCVNTYNVTVFNSNTSIGVTASYSEPRHTAAHERPGGPLLCNTNLNNDSNSSRASSCQMRKGHAPSGSIDISFDNPTGNSANQNLTVFWMSQEMMVSVANTLNQYLSGWVYVTGNASVGSGEGAVGSILFSAGDKDGRLNAARNFTTNINNLFLQWSGTRGVKGTTWNNVTVVEVRWSWLSFLAVEIVLVMTFLGATIVATDRLGVKVWKNSVFAAMLALDQESRVTMMDGNIPNVRLLDDKLVHFVEGNEGGGCNEGERINLGFKMGYTWT
ncbi:hypothetical protein B0H66DRAFT_537833 [Apodospora peruviana]|uniref:Uncharacterized protein n=1 Tax=Apodospora peruviana TaxID=516989 RepID=A0AAE0HTQ8_9PEZI|nr:hypothetical protein B0H66DRAFT_537833 [Apodospora peruviana]